MRKLILALAAAALATTALTAGCRLFRGDHPLQSHYTPPAPATAPAGPGAG